MGKTGSLNGLSVAINIENLYLTVSSGEELVEQVVSQIGSRATRVSGDVSPQESGGTTPQGQSEWAAKYARFNQTVIEAVENSDHIWVSAAGIADTLGVSGGLTSDTMDELEQNEQLISRRSNRGYKLYALAPEYCTRGWFMRHLKNFLTSDPRYTRRSLSAIQKRFAHFGDSTPTVEQLLDMALGGTVGKTSRGYYYYSGE